MKQKMTFEQAINRLAEIVQQMESGKAPLDDTLKLYEEGVKLAAFCDEKLKNAEQTVQTVTAQEVQDGKE